jgi:hypothetical protein
MGAWSHAFPGKAGDVALQRGHPAKSWSRGPVAAGSSTCRPSQEKRSHVGKAACVYKVLIL